MQVFLKTNIQKKPELNIKAKKDPHKNAWMLSHMFNQVARFGILDLKIEGKEETPILLAKNSGKEIGRKIKDKLNRKRKFSLFFWPFEQSLDIVLIEPLLNGKPYSIVKTDIYGKEEKTLLKIFFEGLATEARIGIIVCTIDSGRFSQKIPGMMYNIHHQFEGIGKALGRTIRDLTEIGITKKIKFNTREKIKRISTETSIEVDWGSNNEKKSKINIKAERDPNKNIKILKKGLKEFTVGGNFNLFIKAVGDDEHHLYEDLSIVLGNLLNKILGERKGIMRTAWRIYPLNGGIIILAIDLGRGFCQIDTDIKDISLRSMIHHFFETFSRFAKIDIVVFGVQSKHALFSYLKPVLEKVLNKRDLVKMKEKKISDQALSRNLFKSLGKALGKAIEIDQKRLTEIPSTKGIID